MPESLLYPTSIEQLAHDPRLNPELSQALYEEMSFAKLGSLMMDLPIYGKIMARMWNKPISGPLFV